MKSLLITQQFPANLSYLESTSFLHPCSHRERSDRSHNLQSSNNNIPPLQLCILTLIKSGSVVSCPWSRCQKVLDLFDSENSTLNVNIQPTDQRTICLDVDTSRLVLTDECHARVRSGDDGEAWNSIGDSNDYLAWSFFRMNNVQSGLL